jgi:multiple sugar transport system permease protein
MATRSISARLRARTPTRGEWHEWLTGYLFAAPFIVGFLLFVAYPMLYSLQLVFYQWDLIGQPRWVGLRNLQRLWSDPKAWQSLYNTAYYTLLAVPLQIVLAFSLALALSRKLRGRNLYRAAFYLPIIVPLVTSAVVWQRMFHPTLASPS